jgi:hypothetical protein
MTKARKRAKRCYELSFLSLTGMDDPGDWRLVHGIADTGAGFVCHAWLTDGREVFDPVPNEFFPVEKYCNGWFAPIVTYTSREAASEGWRTGHSGPWHEDIGFWSSPTMIEARAQAIARGEAAGLDRPSSKRSTSPRL